jgi:hypothetical protein
MLSIVDTTVRVQRLLIRNNKPKDLSGEAVLEVVLLNNCEGNVSASIVDCANKWSGAELWVYDWFKLDVSVC